MHQAQDSNYLQQRSRLISAEAKQFLGGSVVLTPREAEANEVLLRAKHAALDRAYKNSSEFLPNLHFFKSKSRIEESSVFKIIKKLPKGGSLHTHLLTAVSPEFLIKNLSYRNNLYGGRINNIYKLKFLSNAEQDNRTAWSELKEERSLKNSWAFDIWLEKQLILNVPDPEVAYPTLESIWTKFKSLFSVTYDMIPYKPVFQDFIYQHLQELYDDNIFYSELKGSLMDLYDLDGNIYTHREFFEIFIETVEKFKREHSQFQGLRYIIALYRGINQEVLRKTILEIIELKKQFSGFIAGLDFVGFEDEGQFLVGFYDLLVEARKFLQFYFHAGETSWFGHTDLNLVDAILLNSSRIGHGFAIAKHPVLKQLIREKKIAIELCPLSNQLLLFQSDSRDHPMVGLMAEGFPIVVCNDDPSAWNTTAGLSYDWYITFMAMTPRDAGLGFLKQLALNSIEHSAMDPQQKNKAQSDWQLLWQNFIQELLDQGQPKTGLD